MKTQITIEGGDGWEQKPIHPLAAEHGVRQPQEAVLGSSAPAGSGLQLMPLAKLNCRPDPTGAQLPSRASQARWQPVVRAKSAVGPPAREVEPGSFTPAGLGPQVMPLAELKCLALLQLTKNELLSTHPT